MLLGLSSLSSVVSSSSADVRQLTLAVLPASAKFRVWFVGSLGISRGSPILNMAASYFLEGHTPRRTDTEHIKWVKALAYRQTLTGAHASNDPRRTDTLHQVKVKLLKSIRGEA